MFARCLSAIKEERVKASGVLKGAAPPKDNTFCKDKAAFLKDVAQVC